MAAFIRSLWATYHSRWIFNPLKIIDKSTVYAISSQLIVDFYSNYINKLANYYDCIFGKCGRLQNKGGAQLRNVVLLCQGLCITATKNSYHQPLCNPLSAFTGHGTHPFGLMLVSFRMWSVWLLIVFWAAVSWRWSSTSWGFSGWFLNCLISSRSCLFSTSKLISLWLIYDISALEGLVLEVSCWIVPLGRV